MDTYLNMDENENSKTNNDKTQKFNDKLLNNIYNKLNINNKNIYDNQIYFDQNLNSLNRYNFSFHFF